MNDTIIAYYGYHDTRRITTNISKSRIWLARWHLDGFISTQRACEHDQTPPHQILSFSGWLFTNMNTDMIELANDIVAALI